MSHISTPKQGRSSIVAISCSLDPCNGDPFAKRLFQCISLLLAESMLISFPLFPCLLFAFFFAMERQYSVDLNLSAPKFMFPSLAIPDFFLPSQRKKERLFPCLGTSAGRKRYSLSLILLPDRKWLSTMRHGLTSPVLSPSHLTETFQCHGSGVTQRRALTSWLSEFPGSGQMLSGRQTIYPSGH